MILRRVAPPNRYAVWAIESDLGLCQVEEFLFEHRSGQPRAMKTFEVLLRRTVPQIGPPWDNSEFVARLRGGVCEFKAREKGAGQPGRGPMEVPRILFFEDGPNIICTHAFMKRLPGSTDDREIDACIKQAADYQRLKRAGTPLQFSKKGWGQ